VLDTEKELREIERKYSQAVRNGPRPWLAPFRTAGLYYL